MKKMPWETRARSWKSGWYSFFTLACAFSCQACGQGSSSDWSTTDGGGGTRTGGVYSINVTIGPPNAGTMRGGNFTLKGGFLGLPTAAQTEGAPTLAIARAGAGRATVSWPPPATNWVLQESWNLTSGWTNFVSGANNPVVVPATLPKNFYRRFKP